MPRAYLVYNPSSGRYPSWLLIEQAAAVLTDSGWDLHIIQTRSGEHVTRLAKEAAQHGMDAFFVTGGDGSINLALPGLMNSETALAVLPAGTANVWAQEIGLPGLNWTRWTALEESARRLSKGSMRRVDLGMCNGTPFLLWASVGLDAFVVHRLEPRSPLQKRFAVVQYITSAVINATQWPGMELRVKIGDQQIEGRYMLALLSNIHLYAGGLAQLDPDAQLDDGQMELYLFLGDALVDVIQHWIDLLAGQHLQSQYVLRYKFSSLRLESNSHLYMQTDGEPRDAENQVSVQVLPQALKVLIPENPPHNIH